MTNTYLVVEDNLLVAADIAEAIVAAQPGARVVELSVAQATAREDAAASAAGGAVAAAFASMTVQDLDLSGFGAAIAASGGVMVVLADDAADVEEARSRGWQAVLRPFMTEDLLPFISPRPGPRLVGET